MVISGEIGCGKTTLIRHLLNNLESSHTAGLVYNTHREIADLLGWIMLAFGLPYEGMSKWVIKDSEMQWSKINRATSSGTKPQ